MKIYLLSCLFILCIFGPLVEAQPENEACPEGKCDEGLYCHSSHKKCLKQKGEGVNCGFHEECTTDHYCKFEDDQKPPQGKCAKKIANGFPCSQSPECINGFCEDSNCKYPLYDWAQAPKIPICNSSDQCGDVKYVTCELANTPNALCVENKKPYNVASFPGKKCKNDSDCTGKEACMPARLVCQNKEIIKNVSLSDIYILSTKKTLSIGDNCTHVDQCRYGLDCIKSKCSGSLENPPDADVGDNSGWKLDVNFALFFVVTFVLTQIK